MADAKKDSAKTDAKPKKGGGKMRTYTIMVMVLIASLFIFPTLVLAFIGLIPTFVAFFFDKDREHSAAAAIGAMNCAGLTPFVIDLMKGQTMNNAFHILGQANNWLIILGASAIGQMIVSVVPQAMATMTLAHHESRVKLLKKNLEQLSESWGPDVGTTKPLDKLTRME